MSKDRHRRYQPAPHEPEEVDEQDAFVEEQRQRWAGQCGMFREEHLQELLDLNNNRRVRLVDLEFLRRHLFYIAQAMASEHWERLFECTRNAYHEAQKKRKGGIKRAEALDLPLVMTRIPMRTLYFLEQHGIKTVQDLLLRTRDQLMAIPQFGPHSLQECLSAIHELGFVEEGYLQ